MRGSAMPPSRRNTSSDEDNQNILLDLGFEEDELEMFLNSEYFYHISVNELIQRYLETAEVQGVNWLTTEEAIGGEYNTKRRIAEATLNSYYHQNDNTVSGGRLSKKSHKKGSRRNKKGSRRNKKGSRRKHYYISRKRNIYY